MSRHSRGSKVPKLSAHNKKKILALVVLVTGTSQVAVAQEATPPAPITSQPDQPPRTGEVPGDATSEPQKPQQVTQPAQPAAPAAPAQAQPAPAARPARPRAQPKPQPQEEYIEEIVVTGSRIPRKELSTAAPVTVISKEQIEATGRTSIGEILQNLPEQSNAINTQYNNGGSGATRVNLRGLGTNRTLVLLNGRRHVAGGSGADATVDLNTIPTVAIERIEVLKDGGSAVYGSDAISGVVNIITRKDFSGTEVRAFSGLSTHGDGLLYDLSLTNGQISERGHLLVSAGYYTQQEVWAGDRAFSYFDTDYTFNSRRITTAGSTSVPEGVVFTRGGGGATGTPEWGALRAQYPNATAFFLSKDGWRPFDTSGVTEAGGDLYNYQPDNYLVTPQQRAHVYVTGGLKLGDSARAFLEASYTTRQSAQKLAPEPLLTTNEGLTVSANNAYNPFGRDFVDVRRRLVEFGTRDYQQDIGTFRVVSGLEGSLPAGWGPLRGWHWDASFNHGRTQGVTLKQGLLRRSRLASAIGPSFINANGEAVCGTPSAPIANCVPLNLFAGPGSITPQMKEYLSYSGVARNTLQQTVLQGNVAGELFRVSPTTRAAGLALGYEHRREGASYIPDPLTASGDTTGNKEQSIQGRYYVNEGYAELSVPVLNAAPADGESTGRDILEFTGAARAFNYNTFGNGLTYKFGGRWAPIPDVTLRATYSTAYRAPSVSEMFQGPTDSFPTVRDPCSKREQGTPRDAACDAAGVPEDFSDDRTQLRARVGGNPNLQPEKANILTAGVVFQPQFLQDVSATVDLYTIDVRSSISRLTTEVILSNCYPTASGQTPQYCERIERDADGFIQNILDPLTNVGGDNTGGVDISLRYQPETAIGRLGFSGDITYLHNFDRELASGVIHARNTYDLQAVYVDWKGNFGVSWSRDALRAGVNGRWLNGYRECQLNTCQVAEGATTQPLSRQVESYATVDVNAAYTWDTNLGTTTVQGGVNNVLDRAPALVFNGFLASSDAATYDYMGRYFYLRLSHTFY